MKPLSKNNNDQAVTYGHVNAAEMLVNKGALHLLGADHAEVIASDCYC